MKIMQYFLYVVVLVFFVMCGPASESDQAAEGNGQSEGIKWASFDSGLKESADNDKYILAYFWRDGSPWCTKLEKGAFSNDQITNYINSKFVPVKVKTTNSETFQTAAGDITTGELLRRLQIRGVPATYFLDNGGNPVFNVPGYVPDDIYNTILRYIAEEHFKNQSFDDYKKSVQEGQ